MSSITPPIGTKGIFRLKSPFFADASVIYSCAALRSFPEMISQGDDPYKIAYEPVGLPEAAYLDDSAAGALMITLLSEGRRPLYVPNTYIEIYPDMGSIPHHWIVASVSCGMLPETYDVTRIQQAIATAVSDYTGIEPTVHIAVAPTTDAITEAQYAQNLAAREAAIKYRSTDYADKLSLEAQLAEAMDQNARLIEMIELLQAAQP